MKYKNIPAMLHNFGHSFSSMNNYVRGDFATDLLAEALRALPANRLAIHFPSRKIEPLGDYPENLRESVGYWADALPRHMTSHGITYEALPEIVLVFFAESSGLRCRVQATDDRGQTHDVLVNQTL